MTCPSPRCWARGIPRSSGCGRCCAIRSARDAERVLRARRARTSSAARSTAASSCTPCTSATARGRAFGSIVDRVRAPTSRWSSSRRACSRRSARPERPSPCSPSPWHVDPADRRARGPTGSCSSRSASPTRATSARSAAQRRGGRRGRRRRAPVEFGRRAQPQDRTVVGRRGVRRDRGGGGRPDGGARDAGCRWSSPVRHAAGAAMTYDDADLAHRARCVVGNEAHGLDPALLAAPSTPCHDPDGRSRGVAQRRHGGHGRRASRRHGSAAPPVSGRRDDACLDDWRSGELDDARGSRRRAGGAAIGAGGRVADGARRARARSPRAALAGERRSTRRSRASRPSDRPWPGRPSARTAAAVGELVGRATARRASKRRRRPSGGRLDLTAGHPRPRPRAPAPRHPGPARARGHLRRARVPDRRGARGRGRLAQLRGAEHPARAPGAFDAGHASTSKLRCATSR